MSEKKTQKKHAAPLSCRVCVSVFGVSPSALSVFCSFGCKKRKKKCVGCRHNIYGEIATMFARGVESAFKAANRKQ